MSQYFTEQNTVQDLLVKYVAKPVGDVVRDAPRDTLFSWQGEVRSILSSDTLLAYV